MITNLRVLQLPVPFRNWVSTAGPEDNSGAGKASASSCVNPIAGFACPQEQDILFRCIGAPADLKELVDGCGDSVAVLVQPCQGVKYIMTETVQS